MEQLADRGVIRAALDDFGHAWGQRIDRWRTDGQTHTEKSFAQQFWSDLLRTFGVIPERIDLFERGAARASTGGAGYIDFFWSGVALGEAKSLDADLDVAHAQALDYLAGGSIGQHEWPKYVLVTDFARIRVERLGEAGWVSEFAVQDAADHVDQLMFLAGRDTVTKAEEQEASIAAAQL
ncbi:type IIL restriction-modification enzyme MmeI, partial [Micrococcus luteus]|uniref:type IIL restriction-modification enzyme MmeI n=1 Tax=Micrococcus luteus TaxID=1270 RepID=UPI0033FAF1B7